MIEFTIPGVAPSTPNLREHYMVKAKRVKAQRAAVARKMPPWRGGALLIVRMTRMAPRALDTDNLAAALKGHRDAVAARLRVDDASPLVEWRYAQAKGEPAVVVQIWADGSSIPDLPKGHSLRKPSTMKGKLKGVSNSALARTKGERGLLPGYTPPRSKPVDAAKEAEVFAPAETYRCDFCKRERPRAHMLLGTDPMDRIGLSARGFNGTGTPWPTAMCFDDRKTCDALHDSPDV